MGYQFVSAQYADTIKHHLILTLRRRPCWLARLLGAKSKLVIFRGSSTVWQHLPSYRSTGTFMDMMLYDFWQQARCEDLIQPYDPAKSYKAADLIKDVADG